jgi:hypothetical protein
MLMTTNNSISVKPLRFVALGGMATATLRST